MKKTFWKYSIIEIKNTFKRFFTLIILALLGIGFFVGIKALGGDIKDTVAMYLNEQNMYDIKLVSNLGLDDDDVEALSKVEGIKEVYGSHTTDAYVTNSQNETYTFRINSITNNINKLDLSSGRMPINTNECIVEENYIKQQNVHLGDCISIEVPSEKIDMKYNEMQIVGIAKSPLYISRERGFSNIGNGKLKYFMYVPDENFECDFYTEIYIKAENEKNIHTLEENYENLLEEEIKTIETIEEERTRSKKKKTFKRIY